MKSFTVEWIFLFYNEIKIEGTFEAKTWCINIRRRVRFDEFRNASCHSHSNRSANRIILSIRIPVYGYAHQNNTFQVSDVPLPIQTIQKGLCIRSKDGTTKRTDRDLSCLWF